MIREILEYQTPNWKRPFSLWLFSLNDKRTITRIQTRIERLSSWNFGDTRLVGTGVWELRFHFGPGYRVYFGLDGMTLVILLSGGDKSVQDKDIRKACFCWQDYLRRKQ